MGARKPPDVPSTARASASWTTAITAESAPPAPSNTKACAGGRRGRRHRRRPRLAAREEGLERQGLGGRGGGGGRGLIAPGGRLATSLEPLETASQLREPTLDLHQPPLSRGLGDHPTGHQAGQ